MDEKQNKEVKMVHYDDIINIHHTSYSPIKVLKMNNGKVNYCTVLQQKGKII